MDIPLVFSGRDIEIPSGMSWRAIAIASFKPREEDASNPEPIAKPSGKLWMARPAAIINPVLNNESVIFDFLCIDLTIILLQIIIMKIPNKIPKIQKEISIKFNDSGIKSKQIIAVIRPSGKL